jgi:6-phosphogluconolactonase
MAAIEPEVRVFADLDSLSKAAAELFVAECKSSLAERPKFQVVLSGGGTPAGLYGLLAGSPFREQVDWSRTEFYWGDERCVPAEDLQSNYRQASDLLLAHVAVPASNIHRVRSELDPDLAAEDYARVLQQHAMPPLDWPRFDLVLLGMGEDGHTASLFPGSPPEADTATLAVNGHYQNRPAWRVTLTPKVINSARSVVFLVSGSAKAGVLAEVLYGDKRLQALPAQRIHPMDGRLTWMIDRGAAAGHH